MKALVVIFLVLFQFAHAADTATVNLDEFYATEFSALNARFETYIEQLDKCAAEMDDFENGNIFLQPVECRKHDKMRSEMNLHLEEDCNAMRSRRHYYETKRVLNSSAPFCFPMEA